MARRPRQDFPGSWHHITNRGVAKRALFESGADARFFLAQLVKQIRLGRIEVHCFCLMTTHFHILARSPVGEISEAMRQVQNEYSRTFNRRHKRDGTLIRGRFFSKPVRSVTYRSNVIRYIDANPVSAGIVRGSWEYSLGSRVSYAAHTGPRWLSREWVESQVMAASGRGIYSPNDYGASFGGGQAPEVRELVEARMSATATIDPLDDLVGSTPARVQAWMRRKARLADGCEIGLPVCGRTALEAALDVVTLDKCPWVIDEGGRFRAGRPVARAGMLRDLCGWSLAGIGAIEGGSVARGRRLIMHHRRLLRDDVCYGEVVARIALEAVG